MSAFVAVLLVSAQATATQQAPAEPQVATEAPKQKPKKICKLDDITSGSRMSKRICLTEDEWAQRNAGMSQSARSGFSGKAEDH